MDKKIISIYFPKNKRLPEELKEMERQSLLEEFKKILNLETLEHNEVEFDILTQTDTIKNLFALTPRLKKCYPSDKLTSLHYNATSKQRFPGVNILRQILRIHGYKMRPVVRCMGYDKGRKLIKRSYLIVSNE
jgi:hypothetical protein